MSSEDNSGGGAVSAELEEVVGIVVPILFSFIAIIGFFGNALVVLVVAFNPQMRSTTNILIMNLAIADLLFIILCVPFTAVDYANNSNWPFGDMWCRIVQYLVIVCAYASIYTLVLMSLDRYLAVVHPITSMYVRTQKNAYLATGLMWTLIVTSCIPALFAHGLTPWPQDFNFTDNLPRQNIKFCQFKDDTFNQTIFQICFFLSSFVIPLALTFILYLLMLKRLWYGMTLRGRISAESMQSKRRATRLVVVVVLIFAVCWCPVQIVLVLKSVGLYVPTTTETIVFQISAQVLAYTNSCVNPFLYAFLSDNFRKGFHKILFCKGATNTAIVTQSGGPKTRNCVLENETTLGPITKTTKISDDLL